MIARAQARGNELEVGLRQAHAWVCQIAHLLEPTAHAQTPDAPTGLAVRECVESALREITALSAHDDFLARLRPAVEHFGAVIAHFRDYLYPCYDIPGLPRTNNDLEQFYRRVKATERRITGHRRSDNFVVRMGGFAAYALATDRLDEADLRAMLARVPSSDWLAERQTLHTIQERQTQMRRFRLHRDAFLADIEARWTRIHDAVPP